MGLLGHSKDQAAAAPAHLHTLSKSSRQLLERHLLDVTSPHLSTSHSLSLAHTYLCSAAADIEQPAVASAASAPAAAQPKHSSVAPLQVISSSDQAQRASSDPTGAGAGHHRRGGLKQRQRDTLTPEQLHTLEHLEVCVCVGAGCW